MYTVSVWNKQSPNFNANAFVRKNGTESFRFKTEEEAIRMMYEISGDNIEKQTLKNPDGEEISGGVLFRKLLHILFD